MKISNNVICKVTIFSSDDKTLLFKKGDVCEVKDDDVVYCSVYYSRASGGWTTFIKHNPPGLSLSHSDSYNFLFFRDYFYTEKEVRKLKLEKINET
jgi:hypothetical protein